MARNEKNSRLTWKNVHLAAVGCMVAGIALILLGFGLAVAAGNPLLAVYSPFDASLGADPFTIVEPPTPPAAPDVPESPKVP